MIDVLIVEVAKSVVYKLCKEDGGDLALLYKRMWAVMKAFIKVMYCGVD